jgi:predicted nucleic acid-binding Zn ribbon protein
VGKNAPLSAASLPLKRQEGSGRTTGALHCRECSAGFESGRSAREFCSDRCRRIFHNRKTARGAQLYDLVMALRYDRKRAATSRAFSLLCRMAAAFKAEDDLAGRQSWDKARTVTARSARFLASLVGRQVAGRASKSK